MRTNLIKIGSQFRDISPGRGGVHGEFGRELGKCPRLYAGGLGPAGPAAPQSSSRLYEPVLAVAADDARQVRQRGTRERQLGAEKASGAYGRTKDCSDRFIYQGFHYVRRRHAVRHQHRRRATSRSGRKRRTAGHFLAPLSYGLQKNARCAVGFQGHQYRSSAHPVAAQDRTSHCSARLGPRPRCHRMRLGGRADGEACRPGRVQEALVVGHE